MGKINWNRVILGGLVAGVIINIFEFALHGLVLAKDMDTAVRALGREVGGGELLMFLAWGFLVGIFAVWLYAAIRPRYGTGPKTALCAGAAVWGLVYLLASVMPIALHIFPRHIMAIGLAVEVLVGTVAGAWLYREAAPGNVAQNQHRVWDKIRDTLPYLLGWIGFVVPILASAVLLGIVFFRPDLLNTHVELSNFLPALVFLAVLALGLFKLTQGHYYAKIDFQTAAKAYASAGQDNATVVISLRIANVGPRAFAVEKGS